MRCLNRHLDGQVVTCGKIARFEDSDASTWHRKYTVDNVDQARETSLFHEGNVLHRINVELDRDKIIYSLEW